MKRSRIRIKRKRKDYKLKCKICGAESGRYPLCWECNKKKEAGEVVKCPACLTWHHVNEPCGCAETASDEMEENFLYELKNSLVTNTEMRYLKCIKDILPEGYLIQPQVNLASFVTRTDGARFQNELYRNVDFVVTDFSYKPLIAIEINDQSHQSPERRARDKKVADICEEAGIPLIKLWTSYGVNQEYIKKRIEDTLAELPVKRVSHFTKEPVAEEKTAASVQTKQKKGCYIATCVYGSYDCPQVWTLRRYRDLRLGKSWCGRAFILLYYAVSPGLVACFGEIPLFRMAKKNHTCGKFSGFDFHFLFFADFR